MPKIKLHIEGMHCVSCVKGVTSALEALEGVESASLNFTSGKAIIIVADSFTNIDKLISTIEALGYTAHSEQKPETERISPEFLNFITAALFSFPFLLHMLGMPLSPLIQLILASIVQFWCGRQFYTAAYHAFRTLTANMDLLIALGTSAAYFFSATVYLLQLPEHLYFETSAMIITLVLFGRWLEARSRRRASRAIEKLLKLQPKTARIERNGELLEIPISELVVGDIFLVRPGENVSVDGTVVSGDSYVDEALLTGESLPVHKKPGKTLFGGTTNQNGVLKGEATQVGESTVLASIVRLVEQAQNSQAPVQRLADKVSEVFVPAVLGASLITFLAWWLFEGTLSTALINAVAVLVIACPCALGMATPTVIMVASGLGASRGILFKEAASIEQAGRLQKLIIDKTGTLTEGKPAVQGVEAAEGTTEEHLLSIAKALESNSQHPLAAAIVTYAKKNNAPKLTVTKFHSESGHGVSGVIDGKRYFLGSVKYAKKEGVDFPEKTVQNYLESGNTVSVVWEDKHLIGCIALADQLRDDAPETIQRLIDLSVEPIMMTGDQRRTGEAIGRAVGIERVLSEVLPEDKSQEVERLKKEGFLVGMVGDGINDAPALAAADVGFAIGAGSDIAVEASDVTLVGSGVSHVADAIELSRATLRKVRQNLFFAFIYNVLGIPLAAAGLLNPIFAAGAMALSSLSVVGNALLLKVKGR